MVNGYLKPYDHINWQEVLGHYATISYNIQDLTTTLCIQLVCCHHLEYEIILQGIQIFAEPNRTDLVARAACGLLEYTAPIFISATVTIYCSSEAILYYVNTYFEVISNSQFRLLHLLHHLVHERIMQDIQTFTKPSWTNIRCGKRTNSYFCFSY